jgi:hypothetical protein
VPLAEHDDMVKTFPSDRADKPLGIAVLPGRPGRDWMIPYAHRSKQPNDDCAVDAIPVANNLGRCLSPAAAGALTPPRIRDNDGSGDSRAKSLDKDFRQQRSIKSGSTPNENAGQG